MNKVRHQKSLFSITQDIIKSLPTESEKREMQRSFNDLIEFLTYLKESLSLLPTKEDISQANQAIQDIITKVEANPQLGIMLGIKKKTISRVDRAKPKGPTENEISRAKASLDILNSLPVEEITSRLTSEEFSLPDLRVIAIELGIKLTKKFNRETLIDHIASKIVNYRGYRLLSGKSENKW